MALPIERPSAKSNFSASQMGKERVGKYGQDLSRNNLAAERDSLFKNNENTNRPRGTSQDPTSRINSRAKETINYVKMPSREEQVGAPKTGPESYRVGKYEIPQRNSVFKNGYARIRDVMKKITGNAEVNRTEKNFMNIKNIKAKERLNKEYENFLEKHKGGTFIKEKDVQKEIRDMNIKEVYMSGTERIIKEKFEDKLKEL